MAGGRRGSVLHGVVTTPSSPVPGTAVAYRDPVRLQQSRRRARRDAFISMASLVAFAVVIAVLVGSTPGWPVVRETFFNAQQFADSLPGLLEAFWLNVRIFLVAEPVILVLSLGIAIVRTLRAPVLLPIRLVATIYVDVFRGVPTILVIFLLGFGVPALRLQGVPNSPVFWGTAALILSYSAYVAEVFRAGIGSVHPSQRMAARSLGLNAVTGRTCGVIPARPLRSAPPTGRGRRGVSTSVAPTRESHSNDTGGENVVSPVRP